MRKLSAAKEAKILSTNQGYWDGVYAKDRGRYPIWARCHIYRQSHPFNKAYGEGFWIGWYNEPAPPYAIIEAAE